MGLPLPGTTVQMAKTKARNAGLRTQTIAFRDFHPESRSGRELVARGADSSTDKSRPLESNDRSSSPRSGHTDAVSGPGIRRFVAVPLLRRSQSGFGETSRAGTGRIPPSIPIRRLP